MILKPLLVMEVPAICILEFRIDFYLEHDFKIVWLLYTSSFQKSSIKNWIHRRPHFPITFAI